jgi:DNA-binding GntR family transcriptional regulator
MRMTDDAHAEGIVDQLYQRLKTMAVSFELKPDERLNESELATLLKASRTPIREALNRLVAEGFLTFQPRKGFFCRPLQPKIIFDLYEARLAIERTTVGMACERGSIDAIDALRASLESVRPGKAQHNVEDLVQFDETFHLGIAQLTGNDELIRILRSIQERIRFVRWIDMENRRQTTFGEHMEIIEAIKKRSKKKALVLIEGHVERRAEQITAVVREGYSRIYIPRKSA